MAAELQRPQMNRRRFAAVTVAAALVALSLVSGAHAAQDGLARTPPMGYNVSIRRAIQRNSLPS